MHHLRLWQLKWNAHSNKITVYSWAITGSGFAAKSPNCIYVCVYAQELNEAWNCAKSVKSWLILNLKQHFFPSLFLYFCVISRKWILNATIVINRNQFKVKSHRFIDDGAQIDCHKLREKIFCVTICRNVKMKKKRQRLRLSNSNGNYHSLKIELTNSRICWLIQGRLLPNVVFGASTQHKKTSVDDNENERIRLISMALQNNF